MKSIIFAILIAFSCSTRLSIIENKQKPNLNLDRFITCFKKASPSSKNNIELIQLINKKDYSNTSKKINDLLKTGNQLVKSCIQYIDNNTKRNKREREQMNGINDCPDYDIKDYHRPDGLIPDEC